MIALASRCGFEYTDPETGLIYLRARYYDPTTAQFLTPDPLFSMTGERYGYADNDPINGSDPTGLCGPFGNGACPGASTVRHVAHDVAAAPGHVAHDVYEHRKGLSEGLAYAATGVAIGACIAASAGVCAVAVTGAVVARGVARAQDVGFGNSWRADAVDAAVSGVFFGIGTMPDTFGSLDGLTPGWSAWVGKAFISAPDIAMFGGDIATGGDALGDRFDDKACS